MSATNPTSRVDSVDVLRGLVMVLMALDHARDFFHAGQFAGVEPLDPGRTHFTLFFTRWITHFCAPVFVFLAGTGAFLSTTRGKSKRELSWFLITRGLFLIVLELTWVRWAGWEFAVDFQRHQGLVIWAIGWSMIVLAALVHLPVWVIAGFGVGMMVGHNALDGLRLRDFGDWRWLWRILHDGGSFTFGPGIRFRAGYPLVPWVGVMAAGYSFGALLVRPPEQRRSALLWLGMVVTGLFVIVRATNLYGDPKAWTAQDSPMRTLFAFLNCEKYPPSLCYLLMTLGPAFLALALLDRGVPRWMQPMLVFGRVPLFYYLLHLPLIHGLSVIVHGLRYGHANWLYGSAPAKPPPDAGFALAWVYVAWLVVVLLLYPACRWFADLKQRRREAWLSYL